MTDVFGVVKTMVVSGALLAMGGLVFACLLLLLSRFAIASFRLSRMANVVQRTFHRVTFLVSVAIACLYGGAKNEGLN